MNKKLMSLLLVLVLALPMVFVTVNALAADPVDVVKTSGGVLNVWAGPVKKAGTSIKTLKNGTRIYPTGEKTYSTADKRWMAYISAPVEGWVDAKYIGKKTVVVAADPVPVGNTYKAKLVGTAPNSIINIWGEKLNAKGEKPLMKKVPLGYIFDSVQNYSNKWSKVTFKTANLEPVVGWVQTRFLANQTVVPPTK